MGPWCPNRPFPAKCDHNVSVKWTGVHSATTTMNSTVLTDPAIHQYCPTCDEVQQQRCLAESLRWLMLPLNLFSHQHLSMSRIYTRTFAHWSGNSAMSAWHPPGDLKQKIYYQLASRKQYWHSCKQNPWYIDSQVEAMPIISRMGRVQSGLPFQPQL